MAVVLNALDDALRTALVDVQVTRNWDSEDISKWCGIGERHIEALLEGREAFTSRDILLLQSVGVSIAPGEVSERRGYRDVRPAVFTPKGGSSIQWTDNAGGLVLDVQVEDVDGREVTLKLGVGLAREIAGWIRDHDVTFNETGDTEEECW